MAVLLLLGTMLALALLGVPLVFSILAASVLTLLVYRPGIPLDIISQLFINGMDQSLLLAIVFFFLAGELMNRGGITRRIIDFANALVGHIRGGLGQVNVVSSIFFSGITGSAVADTAAVGSVMVPAMVRQGYSRGFAAALTQTSSVIGPIIPPSIPMIIYAVLAEVSVGKMFLAGVIPGLLIGICLMVTVYVISRRRDYPRQPVAGLVAIAQRGAAALVALLTPVIIVGGILGGIFTPTEAGAVAALYSFIAGKLIYRELSWRDAAQALVRAAQGTATVMVILGASSIFAWIVADLRISHSVAAFIFELSKEPWLVLLVINLFVLLVGLFMDPLAALVILVPVFLPTAVEIGIDPIHFGIIIVINLMIGLCTPPVGY
ncbi:MAG: TRAP transporter large permease, partial [Candidatus Competibacteraceae bacterium]|nr:TRAP transporter large permease [Candidatus Competibacteraceae bacterium]